MKKLAYIEPEIEVHSLRDTCQLLSHSPGNVDLGPDGDDWTPGAKDQDGEDGWTKSRNLWDE